MNHISYIFIHFTRISKVILFLPINLGYDFTKLVDPQSSLCLQSGISCGHKTRILTLNNYYKFIILFNNYFSYSFNLLDFPSFNVNS